MNVCVGGICSIVPKAMHPIVGRLDESLETIITTLAREKSHRIWYHSHLSISISFHHPLVSHPMIYLSICLSPRVVDEARKPHNVITLTYVLL
jgi:hypothetical protein